MLFFFTVIGFGGDSFRKCRGVDRVSLQGCPDFSSCEIYSLEARPLKIRIEKSTYGLTYLSSKVNVGLTKKMKITPVY